MEIFWLDFRKILIYLILKIIIVTDNKKLPVKIILTESPLKNLIFYY